MNQEVTQIINSAHASTYTEMIWIIFVNRVSFIFVFATAMTPWTDNPQSKVVSLKHKQDLEKTTSELNNSTSWTLKTPQIHKRTQNPEAIRTQNFLGLIISHSDLSWSNTHPIHTITHTKRASAHTYTHIYKRVDTERERSRP
jgi:hypothetical protein